MGPREEKNEKAGKYSGVESFASRCTCLPVLKSKHSFLPPSLALHRLQKSVYFNRFSKIIECCSSTRFIRFVLLSLLLYRLVVV